MLASIKSKVFPIVSIVILLIFYALSYDILKDIINYFLTLPLSENATMGFILFIVGTFSYSLYSLFILFFKEAVPITHTLIFTLLGLGYSAYFIDFYCYPIQEIFNY